MIQTLVDIQDKRWRAALPGAAKLARAAVAATLKAEKHAGKPILVNILLASDAAVHKLNREWRGKDKPTNVLSFPLMSATSKEPLIVLGDIVLARQTLVREAKAEAKTLRAHFLHLVAHGTLHLLGYDHMKPGEARRMEKRELAILKKLGVSNPYAESTRSRK